MGDEPADLIGTEFDLGRSPGLLRQQVQPSGRAEGRLGASGWLDLLTQETGRSAEVELGAYQVRWLIAHP